MPSAATETLSCPSSGTQGRYLIIRKTDPADVSALTLCEVKVYGRGNREIRAGEVLKPKLRAKLILATEIFHCNSISFVERRRKTTSKKCGTIIIAS